MIIGQMLAPVHSLGPGNRDCLWTKGCSKNCENCISPELHNKSGPDVDSTVLLNIVLRAAEKTNCTGLTISGGDPFEQAESLLEFLILARNSFDDILVYTGFSKNEILYGVAGDSGKRCLEYIDVLIDGRYIKELNSHDCVLGGSTNQIIHFINENMREKYMKYMERGRIIENFSHDNKMIITGILDEVSNE